MEDQKLVRQSKRGNRQAFEAIYRKYLDPMLTIAMNLLGDAGLAEEAVQECFIRFLRSLRDFTLHGSLKAYLAACVANRARDFLRQRTRRQENSLETLPEFPEQRTNIPPPFESAVRNEQLEILRRGLLALPYEQREVITLRHHGGLTFKKIAAAQSVPIQTVQSRYEYGLKKLRLLLNGEEIQ
ncbi:MAG TPA: RNA polymerase sigma factor [Anaerohalosphaeraceae bacterium]|nr:RNA polymerase sigma factor [Anaerohalosphaeraceae bacterium]HOL88093.1 RNA polymerase sigma factor [Anaerohalosphaeraceae bacterium]